GGGRRAGRPAAGALLVALAPPAPAARDRRSARVVAADARKRQVDRAERDWPPLARRDHPDRGPSPQGCAAPGPEQAPARRGLRAASGRRDAAAARTDGGDLDLERAAGSSRRDVAAARPGAAAFGGGRTE